MGSPTRAELIAEVAELRSEVTSLAGRQRELTALLQAHQTIVSSLDLEQILQAIVEQAAAISGCTSIRLFLLDEASQVLRYRVGVGLPATELAALEVPAAKSFSGQVASTGIPLAVADTRGDPRVWRPDLASKYGYVSYLGLPVKLASRLFGVLAFSTPVPRTYSGEEIALLSGFADRAALALENARLLHQERQRRRQLEAVRAVSAEVTRELDLSTLLDLITQRAMELTGAAGGDVFLWDETSQLLTAQAAHGLSVGREKTTRRLGEGVMGTVAQRRQGMLLNDYRTSAWALPHTLTHTAITAVLVEPLLYHDRLLGVIGVDREEGGQPFAQQDRETLALFAVQAAIAIENARLHTAAVRRGAELEALLRGTQSIMSGLDLQGIFDRIVAEAAKITGCSHVKVLLVDKEAGRLRVGAIQGTAMSKQDRLPVGVGHSGLVAMTGQRLFSPDAPNDPRNAYAQQDRELGIVTYLGLPIKIRDEVLGVLSFNTTVPRQYTPAELAYLTSFADQAAIAIENARLHDAALRRGAELEALLRGTRSIMSGPDLQGIFDRIVAEAVRSTGCSHVKLLLVDQEAGALRVGSLSGTTLPPGFQLPLHGSLSGLVARAGQPVFRTEVSTDPENVLADQDREAGVVTYLGLPIKGRDEILGVLTFNTKEPRRYSSEELAYLTSFADHAAIAIENARLFEVVRRELDERSRAEKTLLARTQQLEAVRAISEELTRELDLPVLLELIIRRATELVNASSGMVRLWDEATQLLVPHAWTGMAAQRSTLRLQLGEGVAGTAAERREGLIVNDFPKSQYASPRLLRGAAHTAVIAVPLLYRDRLVGVLSIHRDQVGCPFKHTDQELLNLFTSHAAIAIQNAHLFAELNQSYQRLRQAQEEMVRSEKLRALGQMAAGIAHDLNNMLAAILGQVELLQFRVSDPGVQASLAVLETAATDGAHVVRRLQDFARQRTHSSLKPLNLRPVIDEALAITRPRWEDEAQRRGAVITIQRHLDDCPPILGLAPEIREVLTNIILNAVDAMPQGGTLTLTATQVRQPESTEAEEHGGQGEGAPQPDDPLASQPCVELSIRDTGIGMTEAVRQRVFEPFFTTKGGQGTGLGLSVAYGIMERHGGRIQVVSVPGQGTTVCLRFAVAPAETVATQEPQRTPASPQRVLLIEDDFTVRQTLASILQAAGHTVQEADGGAEGIDLLARVPVDLVLTDLGMPGVTGWDVARAVRARTPRLPIILLTGWGEQAAVEAGAEGLIDRVLGKPVRMDDLLQVIADLTRGG